MWQVAKEHQFAAIVSTSDGDATKAGFNKLNDGNYSYALQYVYSPEINGLPGHYLAFASYSSKELQSFSIDRRQLFAQAIGVVPNATKSDNYALLLNFDQYLWVKPGAVDDAKRRPGRDEGHARLIRRPTRSDSPRRER